jgi:hypothetical protein
VSDPAPEDKAPFLRVVKGDATPEELAALVAVLASVGGPAGPDRKPVPAWSAHRRNVRVTFRHGPGGWRSSGLPR